MSITPKLTARQVLDMIQRQGYRCAISGRELTPATAVLDHIVPIAKGGEHSIENVWVVHTHVNTAKGWMTMAEFLSVCRDVVRHQMGQDQEVMGPKKEPPAAAVGVHEVN